MNEVLTWINSNLGLIAVVITLGNFIWGVIKERKKPHLDDAQSSELEERVRKSLETSLLAENDRLNKRVDVLEKEKEENCKTIIDLRNTVLDLQKRDKERENTVKELQEQIISDKLTRDKIVQSLTDQVIKLGVSNEELLRQHESWIKEREEWANGVSKLLTQLINARIRPVWTPENIVIPEMPIKPNRNLGDRP